jgi:L-ascorbate metabolism protein UlaG (beta-lactamase superfamily)
MIDILIVPVGGNGYTLDAIGAEKVIKKIDPKVVIPTHYEDKAVKYEVPQAPIDEFFKQIAVTPEKIDKLKIKNDIFSDNLVVYQIDRS